MDSLLNTTGQQLPNNHFVDPQVWSLICLEMTKKNVDWIFTTRKLIEKMTGEKILI